MGRRQSACWSRPATGPVDTLRAPPPSAHLGGTVPRLERYVRTTLAKLALPEARVQLTTTAGLAGGRDAAGAAAGGAGAAVGSGLGVGGRTLCGGSGAGSLAPIVGPAACRDAVSPGEAVE